jgi:outer membrane protein assembly factor BamB
LTRRGALFAALLAVWAPFGFAPASPAHADVLVNSSNLLRNGWYPDEPALSPATVTGGNFGQLFSANVDGQVYAQPIVSQGTLLVATENNNVYGLDPHTGAQKWQRTYGTPFNPSDIACGDISPHIGITGTPVVDPATNIAYFTDKEYVSGSSGPTHYFAHAIDVSTGAEEPGWPTLIQGYADNASQIDAHLFHPDTQLQRPGLLLMDGVIYMGFGSSCDAAPYTGWIVGISTTTHAITTMFTTIGDNNSGAGIWQSGS